jgi:hypothetical protein
MTIPASVMATRLSGVQFGFINYVANDPKLPTQAHFGKREHGMREGRQSYHYLIRIQKQ